MGESMALVAVIGVQERILYLGCPVGPDFWCVGRLKKDVLLWEERFTGLQIAVIERPQHYREGQDKRNMANSDGTARSGRNGDASTWQGVATEPGQKSHETK